MNYEASKQNRPTKKGQFCPKDQTENFNQLVERAKNYKPCKWK